jgi:metal-responsive CopG/Arc/MetJ family transcriptional regulator
MKTSNFQKISINLPVQLVKKIQEVAEKKECTLSEETRRILMVFFENKEKNNDR